MPSPLPRRLFLVGAALLALAAGCNLKTRGPALAAATPAPSFLLPAHTGEAVSLADLTQKGPAVVVFYRGHW
ncbi:redoxin domain-containing protein [Polyangium spumosum]|uniref:Redoxin domain-containing protein n=1 Tax=Polyangium spumosum TaxID=889282 RepID=A0A6N7PYJ7_9BACT|nr:redoxin domain-containing protein [Polyangium spumosum]MRG96969.1 redoxin domain-containing protein [Polyangium spumosum]